MDSRGTEAHVAAILNAGWMVRHYVRGGRITIQRAQRAEAIRQLGLVIRRAFNSSDDFEPLIAAIVDGVRPKEDPPF